jgi:hypothetical protein
MTFIGLYLYIKPIRFTIIVYIVSAYRIYTIYYNIIVKPDVALMVKLGIYYHRIVFVKRC